MRARASSFLSACLFALGLGVAGMTKPSKVIGFLDLAGDWDASLALVMVGALLVFSVCFRLISKRNGSLFEGPFRLPQAKDIDRNLVLGAALFGVGWGLGGFCPGPGLAALGAGVWQALVFCAAMVLGIKLQHAWAARRPS